MRQEGPTDLQLEDEALASAIVPRGHFPLLRRVAAEDKVPSVPDDQDAGSHTSTLPAPASTCQIRGFVGFVQPQSLCHLIAARDSIHLLT